MTGTGRRIPEQAMNKLLKLVEPRKHGRGRAGSPGVVWKRLEAAYRSAPDSSEILEGTGFAPPRGRKKDAELCARAASRREKTDPELASRLHEKAGDIFRETMRGDPPRNADGTLRDFPERMFDEAIREFRRAADLVRETHPRRARMLDQKARNAEGRKMVDEFAVKAREERRALAQRMMESVHTPPKGDIDPEHFSTSTPWNVGKPKPIRKK